jgi:cytochrome c oxidase cbb3-type subunit 3
MLPITIRLLRSVSVAAAILIVLQSKPGFGQRPTSAGVKAKAQTFAPAAVDAGQKRFQQNCAFCHGRDAGGGESGPDLTHSGVVTTDVGGNKIGEVVRNGRPGGMPKFNVTDQELSELVAFLHTQATGANSEEAKRRKLGLADLLTGNVSAGKEYFFGNGQCSSCHSPTGDLAGIAKHYDPIKLETQMLYPAKAPAKVTVTLKSGQTVTGRLMHLDEFTVSLRDSEGWQRSWPASSVKYEVDSPADAHLKLLPQYTDADVHNLFAYLNTLR